MEFDSAERWCFLFSLLLLFLVALHTFLQLFTPDARVYVRTESARLSMCIFGICCINISFFKHIGSTRLAVMVGVAAVMFTAATFGSAKHELDACRAITSDDISALIACNSITTGIQQSNAEISVQCVRAMQVAAGDCVVGQIASAHNIELAKASGMIAAGVIISMIVVASILIILLCAAFWTPNEKLEKSKSSLLLYLASTATNWAQKAEFDSVIEWMSRGRTKPHAF